MWLWAASDPDAARQFYGQTLGLRLVADEPFALVFAMGDGLTLRVQKVPQVADPAGTAVGWIVTDIVATLAERSGRGVVFERYDLPGRAENGICMFPDGAQVAWFKDPDGNILSLTQEPD